MRIVFAGTPEFAAVSLRALLERRTQVVGVFTQPDRPAGRGRKLAASPTKLLAAAAGLAIFQPTTLRDPTAVEQLAALRPDLLVVVAYGLLLPPPVLALPPLGCVNVHASLLPRWRGAAPIQRAILAGDRETGICLMRMDEGLDSGPVLARASVLIGARESAAELHDRLAELGTGLLLDSLPGIESGSLVAQAQPESGITYAHRLHKDEARIDWSLPAEQVDRQVRAFNPWPVAFTVLGGHRLRIWRSRPLSDRASAAPGTVVVAEGDRLEVACGSGRLALASLQMPGGRVLTAREVINAGRLAVGVPFDAGADERA